MLARCSTKAWHVCLQVDMHSQTGEAEQLGLPGAPCRHLLLCCINPAHMVDPGCHEKLTTVPPLKPGQCPDVKDPFSSFQAGEISVLFLVLHVFSFKRSFRHLSAVWEEPPHQGPPCVKPPLYEVLTQNPKPCWPRMPRAQLLWSSGPLAPHSAQRLRDPPWCDMLRMAIVVILTQAACTCCPETQAFLFQHSPRL